MNEPKFKVGDKVTYKKSKDCIDYNGNHGYYHGGVDNGGYIGVIDSYRDYNYNMRCYEIVVTNIFDGFYTMLESEFVEYNKQSTELFPLF